MDWEHSCMEEAERLVLETLARASEHLDEYLLGPADRDPLMAALETMRQVRGALSLMGSRQEADLLVAAEAVAGAALEGHGVSPHAPQALRRALADLETCLAPGDGVSGICPDLSGTAEGLRACMAAAGGADGDPHVPVGSDEIHHVGEWVSGAQAEEEGIAETGVSVAQIKAHLKAIVEIMPRWWEDLHEEEYLTDLNRSFAEIAERAESLHLSEMAKLAALLERLVAKVNDEMISVTVQMMYGVIEQGVLKLGILFLKYCRPHGSPEDAAARRRLEEALSGMKLLTGRTEAPGAGGGPDDSVPAVGDEGEQQMSQWNMGEAGHRRLEDLFVEANLLHSQLMPRLQMMRQQQQALQHELAGLSGSRPAEVTAEDGAGTWRTADAPDLTGKVASMADTSRRLAKLIGECEECLGSYRQATRELQGAILDGL